jgi:hypothetical protein
MIRVPYERAFFAFPDWVSGSATTRRSRVLLTVFVTVRPAELAIFATLARVIDLPAIVHVVASESSLLFDRSSDVLRRLEVAVGVEGPGSQVEGR